MMPTVRLLGLEFADLDVENAANWLSQRPAAAPFGYVTTPNADHLVRLRRVPELVPIYQAALMRLLIHAWWRGWRDWPGSQFHTSHPEAT